MLKWVREDKIKFIKEEKSGILGKEKSSIDLRLNPTFDNALEKELFDTLYKASGDGILETKELETPVIKIENGIVRIKPFGIYSCKINIITIPLSMLVINANGIYCDNKEV